MSNNAVTEIKVATIIITVMRSPRLTLIPGWNYGTAMDVTLADGVTQKDRVVINHLCDDFRKSIGVVKYG